MGSRAWRWNGEDGSGRGAKGGVWLPEMASVDIRYSAEYMSRFDEYMSACFDMYVKVGCDGCTCLLVILRKHSKRQL